MPSAPPSAAPPPRQKPHTASQQRTPGERTAARDRTQSASHPAPPSNDSTQSGPAACGPFPWLGERGAGGGDGSDGEEGGGGGADAADGIRAAGLDTELDCGTLADELMPMMEDDGIFQILMPNGHTLGVAVSIQSAQVRLLLNPSDAKLAERLRRKKMELEGVLGRRMEKDVDITVL
ncbi:hypothetical protein D3870_21190 [Noviherbaspirillum cavernae]|uniref:Uncharacterized protein n=1 Tax=Noviherbaspirillum cavernae TaxID=2320862 RepID=A0A418WVZ0_9BURK|nr:hypothetical protein D3870_21190 [Noviherbaspirillum cavernae]